MDINTTSDLLFTLTFFHTCLLICFALYEIPEIYDIYGKRNAQPPKHTDF